MCKCSFMASACLAVACLFLSAASAQQDYDSYPQQPINYDDASLSVRSAEVSLIFDESEIVVNPGEPLHLDCGVRGESRYCLWESDNGQIIQVQDVYSDVYDGYMKPENTNGNECGIVVKSATIEHHGTWTCKVLVPRNSLTGSKHVVVTIRPTNPILETDSQGDLYVDTEQEKAVVCSVAAARPAVDVTWYLGSRDITGSSTTDETLSDKGGIYKSVSTLRRLFRPEDNGETLKCSISHKTLETPAIAAVPVNVVFKPLEKPVTTFYQIQPGTDYEVKFNFTANPAPTERMWKFGENLENSQELMIPDVQERYSTDIEDLGNDKYTAKLLIRGFTEEDSNMKYMLVVQNQLGQTEYMVRLSMNEAPQDGVSETSNHDKIPHSHLSVSDLDTESKTLSGGAIAGIFIVLLVMAVALVAAGYARYRQMFCFAPIGAADPEAKDIREEHSDTESARGPAAAPHPLTLKDRLGHITKVFKKPKNEQDVKMEDVEKSLTKEEQNKEASQKEQNPEEKEVVYAELDLTKGEPEKKAEVKTDEKTEYAQIVGTIGDNREEEKKE